MQHETQGANKKPRVVWSVEMHQQVGSPPRARRPRPPCAPASQRPCVHALSIAARSWLADRRCASRLGRGRLHGCFQRAGVGVSDNSNTRLPMRRSGGPTTPPATAPPVAAQFVDAVNQLGVDKAVPKRILDLMNVEGLTRENVASHLQVRVPGQRDGGRGGQGV